LRVTRDARALIVFFGAYPDPSMRSQGAAGALQAHQASSQLLALGVKQQLQVQQLMAAEFRSQVIERSSRAQAEADGREATRRFLGDRPAYARAPR